MRFTAGAMYVACETSFDSCGVERSHALGSTQHHLAPHHWVTAPLLLTQSITRPATSLHGSDLDTHSRVILLSCAPHAAAPYDAG